MANRFAIRVASVSVSTLIRVLEAVSAQHVGNRDSVGRFAGIGNSTTTRALNSLQDLRLVAANGSSGYVCTNDKVKRGADEVLLRQVLRQALLRYRPFELICEGLALGESLDTSRRRASVLLNIDDNDQNKFDVLIKWAKDLEIVEEHDGSKVVLAAAVDPQVQAEQDFLSSEDVESEVKARLYVAARLGRTVYNFIDESERELLSEALLNYRSNPSHSVEKSGQAIENFLRGIAGQQGFSQEARKLNGAGQLASMLVSKGVIHNHQQKLIEAASTVRNAKAHHKDKKTLTPWEITYVSSFLAVTSVLAVMYSIHQFIFEGKQIL